MARQAALHHHLEQAIGTACHEHIAGAHAGQARQGLLQGALLVGQVQARQGDRGGPVRRASELHAERIGRLAIEVHIQHLHGFHRQGGHVGAGLGTHKGDVPAADDCTDPHIAPTDTGKAFQGGLQGGGRQVVGIQGGGALAAQGQGEEAGAVREGQVLDLGAGGAGVTHGHLGRGRSQWRDRAGHGRDGLAQGRAAEAHGPLVGDGILADGGGGAGGGEARAAARRRQDGIPHLAAGGVEINGGRGVVTRAQGLAGADGGEAGDRGDGCRHRAGHLGNDLAQGCVTKTQAIHAKAGVQGHAEGGAGRLEAGAAGGGGGHDGVAYGGPVGLQAKARGGVGIAVVAEGQGIAAPGVARVGIQQVHGPGGAGGAANRCLAGEGVGHFRQAGIGDGEGAQGQHLVLHHVGEADAVELVGAGGRQGLHREHCRLDGGVAAGIEGGGAGRRANEGGQGIVDLPRLGTLDIDKLGLGGSGAVVELEGKVIEILRSPRGAKDFQDIAGGQGAGDRLGFDHRSVVGEAGGGIQGRRHEETGGVGGGSRYDHVLARQGAGEAEAVAGGPAAGDADIAAAVEDFQGLAQIGAEGGVREGSAGSRQGGGAHGLATKTEGVGALPEGPRSGGRELEDRIALDSEVEAQGERTQGIAGKAVQQVHGPRAGAGLGEHIGIAPIGGVRRIGGRRHDHAAGPGGDSAPCQGALQFDVETRYPGARDLHIAGAKNQLHAGLEAGQEPPVAQGYARSVQGADLDAGAVVTEAVAAFAEAGGQGVRREMQDGVGLGAALGGGGHRAGVAGGQGGGTDVRQGGGRRLLGNGELAVDAGVTRHIHGDVAGDLQIAAGIETGHHGAGQGQTRHPRHGATARDGAAAVGRVIQAGGDVLAQPQIARAVGETGPDAIGGHAHGDTAGHDVPGPIGAGLVQGNLEDTANDRRSDLQGGVHRHVQHGAGIGQHYGGAGVQGQGLVVDPAPVHQGAGSAEGAGDQGAVHVQGRAVDVGQGEAAAEGGAAQGGLAGNPLPGRRAGGFGADDDADIHVGKARPHAAGADGSRDACTAEDELVHRGRAAAREGDGLVLQALDEEFAIHREHVGHRCVHLAPQACFPIHELDGVAAAVGGGDAGIQGRAPVVPGDLQVRGRQAHAGDAGEGHIAVRRHRVAGGDGATIVLALQQDGAITVAETGAHAAQAQGAIDVGQADGKVHVADAIGGVAGGHQLHAAGDVPQARHVHRGGADVHFLQGRAVGEGQVEMGGETGGDGLADRSPQVIDAHGTGGRHAHVTAEAGQCHRTRSFQGVGGVPGGVLGQDQAKGAIGEGRTGAAATQETIHARGANEDAAVRAGLLLHREIARQGAESVDGHTGVTRQGQIAAGIEAGGETAAESHPGEPRNGRVAADAAGPGAADGQVKVSGTLFQGYPGAAAGHRHGHVGGMYIPTAVRLQGHVKTAGQGGRPHDQGTIYCQVQGRGALVQGQGLGLGNGYGLAAAAPVDDGSRHVTQAGNRPQEPVHVKACGRLQIGQVEAGEGSAPHIGLAGEPAAVCTTHFAGQHHGDVHIREAGLGAGLDGGGNAGPAENELIHRGGAAAGEIDSLVGPGLDEHVAANGEHAGHIGHHIAAQAGLVVEEIDRVAAKTRIHHRIRNRRAHPVIGDLHVRGSQADGARAAHADRTFRLHGVGRGAGTDLVQQHGPGGIGQGGAHGPQIQGTADTGQANAHIHRIADGDGTYRQGAAEGAQASNHQAAVGDGHFLHCGCVGEAHRNAGAAHGEGLAHRLAQGIDAHRGRGGQAHIRPHAGEGGVAGSHQGIAGRIHGPGRHIQGQGGVADADAHAAGAKAGRDAGGAHQDGAVHSPVHGEVAAQRTEASNRQAHARAGEGQVAGAIKTGVEVAGEAHATQAIGHRVARQATALAGGAQHQAAVGRLQAHVGRTGGEAQGGIGGGEGPGLAITRLGQAETTGEAGRAQLDDAVHGHRQAAGCVVQGEGRVSRQGDAARGLGPLHHCAAGLQGAAHQLAIEVQGGGIDGPQFVAGKGGAANAGAAGDPAPGRSGSHDFRIDDHGNVGVREADAGAAANADAGGNARAPQDELVYADGGTVREIHRRAGDVLDEHVAADGQHARHFRRHLAAQAGFVLEQTNRIATLSRGHVLAHGVAPLVPGDLQIVGGQGHAGDAGEGHAALGLHRIAVGDRAICCHFLAQDDGAGAAAEAGPHAAQTQAAGEAFQANGQVGVGRAGNHLIAGN